MSRKGGMQQPFHACESGICYTYLIQIFILAITAVGFFFVPLRAEIKIN